MSRKKHPQSRWCGGRARYSTERMTMDARWVKDGRGQWRHENHSYRDDLMRVFVDTADDAESRQYFIECKERLKAQFQQIDIWMTTYLIEVL